jgi:hypothetical protein
LYNGTYTSGSAASRVKFSSSVTTPPTGNANVSVLRGDGGSVPSMQPISAGSVYTIGNPEENVELATFVYHVLWTPDVNGNGVVEDGDLTPILTNWGLAVPAWDRSMGDLNGNGIVEDGDLTPVLTNWGQSMYGSPGIAPVPEPSTICLLATGFGLGLARLYRRRAAV